MKAMETHDERMQRLDREHDERMKQLEREHDTNRVRLAKYDRQNCVLLLASTVFTLLCLYLALRLQGPQQQQPQVFILQQPTATRETK